MTNAHLFALVVCILGLGFCGCSSKPHVPPAGFDCVAACTNLQSLSCPEGDPTPAGVPCSQWLCETPMPEARTSCVSHASSCEAARACK